MGSSQNVALDAEHDLARFRLEKTGLQPRAMVLKNLFGEAWKELAEIKKRRFLFDDLMDGDAAKPDFLSHFLNRIRKSHHIISCL
jgi:hypothetical protein